MHFYLPRKLVVESVKPLKDLFDLKKLIKKITDYLHIPNYDTCCDAGKTEVPVHYDMDGNTAEYYDPQQDEWIPFGGGNSALDAGEATTPNGTTLDWGGIITHDVNVDSDGINPLPSIFWGADSPMRDIEFNSTRTIGLNSNDVFVDAGDSFDVDSTNVGFNQTDQFNVDAAKVSIRGSSFSFLGSNGGTLGFWHFTTNADKTNTEEGFQCSEVSKTYQVGDFNSVSNDTLLTVNDTTQKITLTANNGIVVGTVQQFTDNAAAVTGGLAVGTLYRTGDTLKIVH